MNKQMVVINMNNNIRNSKKGNEESNSYIQGVVRKTRIKGPKETQQLIFGSLIAHVGAEVSHFLNTQALCSPYAVSMLRAPTSHQKYSECPNLGELG